jgi:hypothetical protein
MNGLPPAVEVAGIKAYRADSAAAKALYRCRRLEVERDAVEAELLRLRSGLLVRRSASVALRAAAVAVSFAAGFVVHSWFG